jgi:hypothetical protein
MPRQDYESSRGTPSVRTTARTYFTYGLGEDLIKQEEQECQEARVL